MAGAVLGFCFGAYQYRRLSKPKRHPALLAGAEPHATSLALSRAAWLARDLINTPANLLGPAELAEAALALGRRFGAECHHVRGRGPARRSIRRSLRLGEGRSGRRRWPGSTGRANGAGADAKHIWLCGKGVCFDTGGYDLKPPSGMLRMKKDMGGAALLLALGQRHHADRPDAAA